MSALAFGAAAVHPPALAQDLRRTAAKLELTGFILQDLEFKLLTWMPPEGDADAIDDWIRSTEGSLEKLSLMAREAGLDQRAVDAVRKVGTVVDVYRQFLRDLRILDVIHETVAAATGTGAPGQLGGLKRNFDTGYDFGLAAARFVRYMTKEALKAAASHGATMAFTLLDSVEAAQRNAAVAKLRKDQVRRLLADTQDRLFREVGYLSDITGSLQTSEPALRVPAFRRLLQPAASKDWLSASPFAQTMEAYRLMSTNRIAAARRFAATARQVPPGATDTPLAAAYVAAFPLIAGHVLEFESRVQGDSRLSSEALRYFDEARPLLRPQAPAPAFAFELARARALMAVGKVDQARTLARSLATGGASDDGPIVAAGRAYDLAGLLSHLGATEEALQQLQRSYAAAPRRDPQALTDPALAPLRTTYPSRVRSIVHHPLVGAWESGGNKYVFYADGTFWQRRVGAVHVGTWTTREDGVLILAGRREVDDASARYELTDKTLTLYGERTFTFVRADDPGLLDGQSEAVSRSGRRLLADGAWTWADGSQAAFARFTTSRSANQQNRTFWYSHEDPLIGRISQVLEQE